MLSLYGTDAGRQHTFVSSKDANAEDEREEEEEEEEEGEEEEGEEEEIKRGFSNSIKRSSQSICRAAATVCEE
ncbi:hypothetical protein ACHAO1_002998 [Botrytis cinerea]